MVRSPVEGVEVAISAWAADQCDESLGQEVSPSEEKEHTALVRAVKDCKLDAWGKFDGFALVAHVENS